LAWLAELGKILITGGSGFIGGYLINQLKREHDVTVIDKNPPKYRVDYIIHDLRKTFKIDKSFDICIQLASIVGGIQYFRSHPAENVHDNSLILSNVFEACVNSNIGKVIYASSSVVYQYAKIFPTPEEETERIPPPSSAYGLTKFLGEYFCKSYYQEYGLKYTILRPFNAYGPGEPPDMDYAHVIPQLIRKVFTGQYPVPIYGSGEQTRCFTYGSDIAEAFELSLYNKAAENQIFNVSSDEEIRIIDLLQKIWDKTKQTRSLKVKHLPSFPEDVIRRYPTSEKIMKALGWKPKISLDVGLTRSIAWIKNQL